MTDQVETFAREAAVLYSFFQGVPSAHTSGRDTIDEYFGLLERKMASLPEERVGLCTLFVEALKEFITTDNVIVNELGKRARELMVDEPGRRLVVRILNEHFVFATGRELTGHNIQRTFRFWSSSEKQEYVRYCSEIADLLDQLFGRACVGFGAVLSFIRERDLMPHDDDLDVVVVFPYEEVPTYPIALGKIEAALTEHGYKVRGAHPAHRWVSKSGFRNVDVFCAIIEDGRVSSHPAPRRAIPLEYMFPAIRAPILGIDCLVPRNPWKYVEAVYGPDWETPTPVWSHRAKPGEYASLLAK